MDNEDNRIKNVVNGTPCHDHGKRHGQPCWWIHAIDGRLLHAAVCNKRAKKFGLNGPINPRSLQRSGR